MGDNFSPDAIDVEVLDDFVLKVTFDDGNVSFTDMKPQISCSKLFAKLRNKYFFSLAHIGPDGGVSWPGDLDFAAEFFYHNHSGGNHDLRTTRL